MTSLESSICLVTQATHQDEAKNYEEAARCYREAIVGFKIAAQNKNLSGKVREAILRKCAISEDRLKKIDRYLLSKADLTSLFKSCVDFHENSSLKNGGSEFSLDIHGDMNVDDPRHVDHVLRQGHEAIEKAKRLDEKRNFRHAVGCYEQGVQLWLSLPQDNQLSQKLLFKSLLIRERIESIRDHLETGAPIKDRRDISGTLEKSFDNGFDSCTVSPEPLNSEINEDEAFLMEEIRSNLSLSPSRRESLSSSRHSLYPTVCEVSQSLSLKTTDLMKEDKVEKTEFIPLADLNQELQLSMESFVSYPEPIRPSSSLRSSLNDVHLIDHHFTFESSYERDCNITELSYVNSELDMETFKNYLNNSNDSGSDSGIGDQSNGSVKEIGSSTLRTPLNSPVSVSSVGKVSPVPSLHSAASFRDLTNLLNVDIGSSKSSKEGSPLLSARPSTRSSSLKRSKAEKVEEENELLVVSTEEIIDGKVIPRNATPEVEVYQKGGISRPEYVPPRAFAYQPEADDTPISKGCFYFVGCLDSLWIL